MEECLELSRSIALLEVINRIFKTCTLYDMMLWLEALNKILFLLIIHAQMEERSLKSHIIQLKSCQLYQQQQNEEEEEEEEIPL